MSLLQRPRGRAVIPISDQLDSRRLPTGVVVAAAWSLCLLLIAGAGWLLVHALGKVTVAIVPLAVALLLSAMLRPVRDLLHHRLRLPHQLASLLTVFLLIALVVGAVALVAQQVAGDLPVMKDRASTGVEDLLTWLSTSPLHLTSDVLSQAVTQVKDTIGQHSSTVASGVVKAGSRAVDLVAGTFITLIALYFFLDHGERIWRYLVDWLPSSAREKTFQASRRGWRSLGSYARTQIAVASINAAGIGIGAAVMKLPFVVPIIVVTFLTSFVPIVGALLSGVFAVLIAFVDRGPWMALIMVAVVIGVHLLEAHGLQPFLMGHAVALHPLAVIVVVAMGTYLFGLVGALFAVPLTATLNSFISYLVDRDPFPDLRATDPTEVVETPVAIPDELVEH